MSKPTFTTASNWLVELVLIIVFGIGIFLAGFLTGLMKS